MNDKPTINPQTLPPLTKFIYTLGQLPSSYLMSMTFEEQLVWLCNYLATQVIPAVNQNGEAVLELQNLYELLRSYVNNYFDNLDVQEEINNKLDEMAQDGTLTNLIKNYIDPYINAQNQEIQDFKGSVNSQITSINNMVTSLSSGSPLVASSTDEMTDTSRVYVNTTDGKWYYYDGDSWEIGGTYQSSGIADGSIDILMFNNPLKANFNIEFDDAIVPVTPLTKYYKENADHEVTATDHSSYSSYIVDLTVGTTYLISVFNRYSTQGLLITNSNNKVVYNSINEDTSIVSGASLIINVKENGMKAYINRIASDSSAREEYVLTMVRPIKNINNNLKLKTEIESLCHVDNKFIQGNQCSLNNLIKFNIGDQNNYTIYVYPISAGLKYSITSKDYYNVPGIVITDTSFNLKYMSWQQIENPPKDVSYTFVAETDGYALLPTIESSVSVNHTITLMYNNIDILPKDNILYGKVALWNGDSIAYGAGNNGVSYADYISNEYNMTYTKYAVGGRCIAKRDGHTSILETIPNMSDTADFVCFEGGWNDQWNVDLGSISDGFNAELDEYTWSGALESLIKQSIAKWPTAHIFFVLAHGKANNTSEITRQNTYWDRAIDIFNKWHLPYIDLRHNGLCAYNNTLLDMFFQENESTGHGDGTHPNELGYKTFYDNQIAKFMNTL